MDFTREPIIETVITPKEGCKLVVRSSKSTGQEEYFVDAVEVVSFGHSFFFRSLERPKMFFVPATDYEILEVREARMVLKNVGLDRTIKIGGGRDNQMRTQRDTSQDKPEAVVEEVASQEPVESSEAEKPQEGRSDKKRDRRRHSRRRRGREGTDEEVQENGEQRPQTEEAEGTPRSELDPGLAQQVMTTSILTSLLPPPPTLISETIARYKDNALFKDAFYTKEERPASTEEVDVPVIPIEQPQYGSFEVSEEEEERIYQQRKQNAQGFDDDSNLENSDGEPHNGTSAAAETSEGEDNHHIPF